MKFKIMKTAQIPSNSMKLVKVRNSEILLVHTKDGKYYATQNECPHEGAPLDTGMLIGNKIICPWHHACFNCRNGEVIEPPAHSDLESYEVTVENNEIYINTDDITNAEKTVKFQNEDIEDKTFIIIGAGASGITAASTLRKLGFNGKIMILSDDEYPPYDRTELSKKFMQGNIDTEDLILRTETYFLENKIDLILNMKVSSLDTLTKTITLENGKNIVYDKLLIASGSKPNIPYLPGTDLNNIHTLRGINEAKLLLKNAKKFDKCVIIGSGFIALETASSLSEYNLEITIVTKSDIPFKKILGEEIGRYLLTEYENKGIKFKCNTEPLSFIGKEKVEKVELTNGEEVETDFVLLGVGVKPSAEFIMGRTLDDGSLEVDEFLNFTKDVYAAGDVATFPDVKNGNKMRIEHWRTAQQQGKTAAFNMLNKKKKFKSIPFFQTSQLGQNIQYVGFAKKWDEIYIDGKIEANNFLAYYLVNGEIKAVAGAGKDEELMIFEELFRLDQVRNINNLPPDYNQLKKIISN